MLKNYLKNIFKNQLVNALNIDQINLHLHHIMLQNGKILSEINKQKRDIKSIHEIEYKIFSQWGDDGIIQYLVNYLDIEKKIFIEFGIEDYLEANTRFLLINNNWSGLIMDASKKNIKKIKQSPLYWQQDLIAKNAFITKDNINQLIEEENINGNIGLLHIDIDGNDYWIWKELRVINPVIIILEYNSVFGSDRAITIPYNPDFVRTKTHHSNLYFGASLLSLCDMAEEKGYALIGCNSAGNNAFFVKKENLKTLKPLTAKEGYIVSKFRESRDVEGNLTFLRREERLKEIKGLPVFNTRLNKLEKL